MLPFLLLVAAGSNTAPPPTDAILTLDELKSYLRIEFDDEDTLLESLISSAQAILENLLGDVPLTSAEGVFVDDTTSGIQFCAPRVIIVPRRPISATVSVVDNDGSTIDSSLYRVDQIKGLVTSKPGTAFANGPYTITCQYGLQYRRDYTSRVVPLLKSMVRDIAADLYQRRTPAASAEGAAGTTATWNASSEVITRLKPHIKSLRPGVSIA